MGRRRRTLLYPALLRLVDDELLQLLLVFRGQLVEVEARCRAAEGVHGGEGSLLLAWGSSGWLWKGGDGGFLRRVGGLVSLLSPKVRVLELRCCAAGAASAVAAAELALNPVQAQTHVLCTAMSRGNTASAWFRRLLLAPGNEYERSMLVDEDSKNGQQRLHDTYARFSKEFYVSVNTKL